MNQSDELLLKLMLTLARDRRAMQGRVKTVGFMREYLTLPPDLGVHTLSQLSEQDVTELAQSVAIKLKSDTAQFHFYLNDMRYKLLQAKQKLVTVVDELSVDEWKAYEKHAKVEQQLLDTGYEGSTTIKLALLDARQVEKLLDYMLFVGNDKGPSMHQAEGLFIFEEALNMNSWTIMSKEHAISYMMEHGYIDIKVIDGEVRFSLYVTI